MQVVVGNAVTPFVGVWIETNRRLFKRNWVLVTPFVGVWIETQGGRIENIDMLVTPFVGVWIETYSINKFLVTLCGHTLRGCVD